MLQNTSESNTTSANKHSNDLLLEAGQLNNRTLANKSKETLTHYKMPENANAMSANEHLCSFSLKS